MAITTNTQVASGGVVNHSTGVLINDAGGAVAVVLEIGYYPRQFRVTNVTDRITYEWSQGMTQPGAIKTVAAGTRTLETAEAPNVALISDAPGRVTIPATIILASKLYVWDAVG